MNRLLLAFTEPERRALRRQLHRLAIEKLPKPGAAAALAGVLRPPSDPGPGRPESPSGE